MTDIISKRELIVAEFRRRLAVAFPQSQIDRGFAEESVTVFDHFYLFDLPEACELSSGRRGQYTCNFGISVSYWTQWDEEDMYPAGNRLLEEVRLAIELDEYLQQGGPRVIGDKSSVDGPALCTGYAMDEGAVIWYDEGVIDTELLYVVEYTKEAGWMNQPFKR